MARQRAAVQVNQFIGGIRTESNPLSFPENSSLDESNLDIESDGSRSRRPGFDVEESYSSVDTGVFNSSSEVLARGQLAWPNPGGFPNKQFLVVQLGNYLGVHDLDNSVVSSETLYSNVFSEANFSQSFGLAVVDGSLVVATGEGQVHILTYDGESISLSSERLLIRDFFGVDSVVNGEDLTDPQNQDTRPSETTDNHTYNLRNQTFALPRVDGREDVTDLVDPIDAFYQESESTAYPSNADNVVLNLYANASFESNRTVERYNAEDAFKNQVGTSQAPLGHFIIDALNRGLSRLSQIESLQDNNPTLTVLVEGLPEDSTSGGATALGQYAGRVWYGGFSGEVVDGDSKSPKLSSYLLFSKLVQAPSDIIRCYQEADPTSIEDPNLVDTDGGFLKIDGAYGIKALVPSQSSLFVFAENGVWRVVGSDGDVFRPTGYSVFKISDEGCIAPNSVVTKSGFISYWGESDINVIQQNQVGDWEVSSLSEATVQTLYDSIPVEHKSSVVGYYDTSSNSVRWVYGASPGSEEATEELILNLKYSSFTKNKVYLGGLTEGVISVSSAQPQSIDPNYPVQVGASLVVVGEDDLQVLVPGPPFTREASNSLYCILLESGTTLKYTFGGYSGDVLDWETLGGVDSPAFLITGPVVGDARLLKTVPYLTTYMKQVSIDSERSSCFLSSRWDWSSDGSSGKWTTPRQVYRPSRVSSGDSIASSKSRIRGSGRAVSFAFESEEGIGFRLYGWGFNLTAGMEE